MTTFLAVLGCSLLLVAVVWMIGYRLWWRKADLDLLIYDDIMGTRIPTLYRMVDGSRQPIYVRTTFGSWEEYDEENKHRDSEFANGRRDIGFAQA